MRSDGCIVVVAAQVGDIRALIIVETVSIRTQLIGDGFVLLLQCESAVRVLEGRRAVDGEVYAAHQRINFVHASNFLVAAVDGRDDGRDARRFDVVDASGLNMAGKEAMAGVTGVEAAAVVK